MDRSARTHTLRLVALTLGVLLAVAVAHAYAELQWRASFGDAPYQRRLEAARSAAKVEPWVGRFASRPDRVMAEEYGRRNQPGNRYAALRRAIELDPRDERLRAQLKEAYAEWNAATTWKAHVQHAREQTGGVLRPEDVIP